MGVLIRISAVVLMALTCCLYSGCAGPDGAEPTMKDKAAEAVDGMKDKAAEAMDGMKDKASEAMDGMKEKASEAVDGMKEKATEAMGSGEKAAEGSDAK